MSPKTVRILIIEDNDKNARSMRDLLGQADVPGQDLAPFEVIRVSRLAEGLARLDEGGIDAVLSALELPDSSAGETVARLQAQAPRVPLVVVSGQEDEGLARAALNAGAADWVPKRQMSGPLLARALLYAIEQEKARAALQEARATLKRRVEKRTAKLERANEQLRQEIAERRLAERTLQESEEKYRAFFSQSVWGIYLHDLEGRILDVNEAACQQLGYSRDEMLKLTVFDLLPEPPDTSNMPKDEILRLWHEWQPEYRSTIQGEHRRKDGTIFPMEVSTGVVRYGEKNLLLAIVQDITEREQAAAERERLREQLAQAQKMEAVGRLAGGVAHDFNNMLEVIIGHVELAMSRMDPSHPLHDGLAEIHQAARRSADLTRQLLAFARKQVITPRVLDLNEAVASMLAMLRRLIGEGIDLSWEPGVGLWPIEIDPGQLNQILINLCLNARDAIGMAGREGGGTITVETENIVCDQSFRAVRAEFVPGEYVQLTVSDDGCGMEKEVLDILFEPYFTTKAKNESGGLGLATVYGAVKMNQGFIHVYSEPGRGTTFKIYLPRSLGQVVPLAPPPPGAKGGRETVLLVEDEPAVLRLARTVLGRLGYVVLAAGRPAAALQQAAKHPGAIDLLITDVVMPEMNGRELAARIGAIHPNLQCLYMSGYTANVIARQGVLDEGIWFLQKPFSIDELAIKVREILDAASEPA
ncbi:MAG: response regulator [Anaerolineae bacterium]